MFIYFAVALALIWVLGFLAMTLFNNAFLFIFLFIEYKVGAIYKLTDYPPIAGSRYFKNYFSELFYALGKYYLLPLKWINLSVTKNKTSKTAILLVHGYCRNQSDWWWLRKQFKTSNCPVFTINLQPELAGIVEITSASLPQKIAQIKQRTNCQDIILIGHSMGGLVSSYYSEFLDQEKIIKAVITVASPLHGSKVSVTAKGENAKQMCPQSEFLQELLVAMNRNPQKYYQIVTRFDNLVFPWRSELLENAKPEQQLILATTAHLSALHSKEVAKQLDMWVREITQA